MEIVNLIVNGVGFVGLAFYIWLLKGQIKSQRDILDSQNETIKNMKMFVDIFQPEKIHEFVKMREVTFEDKRNKDIEKIKSEMEKDLKKKSNILEFLTGEYKSMLDIMFNLIYYVQPEIRKRAIEDAPNSAIKRLMISKINDFPFYGDVYANALRQVLNERKPALTHPVKPENKH
jgi:hypothetical protein